MGARGGAGGAADRSTCVHDLTSRVSGGFAHGTRDAIHDLTYIGSNIVQGISNGAIWSLIAIGYTLVYGIIELINFAHGDVFMIGSFTGAGFWATIGLGLATGPLGLILGLPLTLLVCDARLRRPQRADRAGRLPAAAERAEARAADHRGRVLVHPPERRATVARGLAVGASPTWSMKTTPCSTSQAS